MNDEEKITQIRDDNELAAASAMIDRLLRRNLDEGEQEYLDVLTDLVEAYEDEHVPIPEASESEADIEAIRAARQEPGSVSLEQLKADLNS